MNGPLFNSISDTYLQSWMGEQKFKRYDFRNFELTKALERLLGWL